MAETFITHNEEETVRLGEKFSEQLKQGDVVALFGDLGSGKTRFAKGISKGMGIAEQVTSPTFIVVNEYLGGTLPLYHFDLYRMKSVKELEEIGFDEYIFGNGVCVLEWAEKVQEFLPKNRFDIHFELGDQADIRMITIEKL